MNMIALFTTETSKHIYRQPYAKMCGREGLVFPVLERVDLRAKQAKISQYSYVKIK